MTETDLELLQRYSRDRAEDAFAEIVRRHVDLVHSAALRQVRSPQLAEEVAQSTFTDLARNAARLKPQTILTAWLYQVARRTAIDVVRREARRQLREQIATEMNAMNASGTGVSPVWGDIEQHLDEAMSALDDTDRAAVLLRYFENKSFREVGATLGTSDDATQKRVSRAVERLRVFFAKRGVTVGASGLAVVISANAVQAAPVGLAITISTAVTLAGTAIAATATATATKAIAMTTLQKTLITATIATAVGTGIYQAHQASSLRDQVQTLQQQQAPLAEQIHQWEHERDGTTQRIAALQSENQRLSSNTAELLKLRGAVGVLRRQLAETTKTQGRAATPPQEVGRTFTPEDELKQAGIAKLNYAKEWLLAFHLYADQNQGQFPTNFDQAAHLLRDEAKIEANLKEHEFLPNTPKYGLAPDRYEIMYQGSLTELTNAQAIIVIREKEPWQTADGSWVRAYGFADGHSEIHKATDGNFETWEAKHMIPGPNPRPNQ